MCPVPVPVADAGAAADELEEEVVCSVLDADVVIDDDVMLDAEVAADDDVVLRVELAEGDGAEDDDDFTVLVGEEPVEVDVPETGEGEATEEVVERGAVEDEAGEVDVEDDTDDVATEVATDELLAKLDAPPLALDPLATPVE
jgi:hypothetical protein